MREKQSKPLKISKEYFMAQRWFQNKGATIVDIELADELPLTGAYSAAIFNIRFSEIPDELYMIPVWKSGSDYYDVSGDVKLLEIFYRKLLGDGRFDGTRGYIRGEKLGDWNAAAEKVELAVVQWEASNFHAIVKKNGSPAYFLKLARRLRDGKNVEAEVNHYLHQAGTFGNSPALKATAAYHMADSEYHLASLFDYIPNKGSGWDLTLAWLKGYLSDQGQDLEDYKHKAYNLGETLADLHITLAGDSKAPFERQPIESTDVVKWCDALSEQADITFDLIEKAAGENEKLREVISKRDLVNKIIEGADDEFKKLGWKIRQHADFHLGQTLAVDGVFYIIDFEGEPLKPYDQRAIHYPALKDAAGMIRSFNYASFAAYFSMRETDAATKDEILKKCIEWEKETSCTFLAGYYDRLKNKNADFLPLGDYYTLNRVLYLLMLEKALYEIEYEINNRPDWLFIPLGGVLNILENFYEGGLLNERIPAAHLRGSGSPCRLSVTRAG